MSRVILYIARSEDGFIADKDGRVDWLPQPSDERDEVGYHALLNQISSIVMGRRSYQQIVGFGPWAWNDKMTYVFSSQAIPPLNNRICFTNENVETIIAQLKSKDSQNDIWLLGGAELIKSFDKKQLINQMVITIIPMKLDEGIPLELNYEQFRLNSTKKCQNGIIQEFYTLKNNSV